MRSRTIKHNIKRTIIGAGALSLLAAAPAFAAPPSAPSGEIMLMNPPSSALKASGDSTTDSGPTYGGDADFHTEVRGKISDKARIYVSLACSQDNDLVYLSSQFSSTGDYSFALTDQAGQGLNWENGGDAECEAWLIYRVEKGKKSEITVLSKTTFDVAGIESAVLV
jgi:hypothetical protein